MYVSQQLERKKKKQETKKKQKTPPKIKTMMNPSDRSSEDKKIEHMMRI